MMGFDITAVNPLLVYGLANQTQSIDYMHDYSRIRLSPYTCNLSTWYTSDMNANRRVYDFDSMSDLLDGVRRVTDLMNIIDTSNVVARDLNDEDIIAEDISNLIG